MKSFAPFLCLVGLLVACVDCDVYVHSPRGSNNRLNEKSANRKNANRVFDSQNNNRGGYNVGDRTDKAFTDESGQFNMEYFQSGPNNKNLKENEGKSLLTIEWTNQHGCGGNEHSDPHKLNCNVVLQYMCEKETPQIMRNGKTTNTPKYKQRKYNNKNQKNSGKKVDTDNTRAVNEPWEWYDKCSKRQRNKGLFTADQKPRSEASKYTRQNPNGNRYGYECPEERDYYPYWHPTDWKDIAVFAHDEKFCEFYRKESFNVKPKGECLEYYDTNQKQGFRHASKYNNKKACEAGEGIWVEFSNFLEKTTHTSEEKCKKANTTDVPLIWKLPYQSQTIDQLSGTNIDSLKKCLVALPPPDCKLAPWSRDNHLGNGREGVPLNYTWVLPHFPYSQTNKQRCVFRIRYNISTDDYDPFNTNSSRNQNLAGMVLSPVQQNEVVDIGAAQTPFRLAINTAQYGRTFQDRSHVFKLSPRGAVIKENETVYNVNVRGKRGNIVQVYPAVEYDFIPNRLTIKDNELVHFQWTGSNTHNNGNPAGDGQAGDAGEGKEGTDRNNIVEVLDSLDNFPVPFENATMFPSATIRWSSAAVTKTTQDLAVSMASAGYYGCLDNCNSSPDKKNALNNLLNNAPASYRGAVIQLVKGRYNYICTRNNNFSNRSQKGFINVIASKP